MKVIKMLFMGTLMGLIVGLWLGVNIGKGNPIFGNPFAEENLSKKLILFLAIPSQKKTFRKN